MAFFFTEHAVSDCRHAVPTIRRGCTQNTHVASMTNTAVSSEARTWNACLWLSSWTAQDVLVVASLCAWNSLSSGQPMSSPCWSLPHLLSSSPQPPGQHDLLQDDTVHREPLLQEPLPPLPETTLSESNARSESNAEKSLTLISRVPETCA